MMFFPVTLQTIQSYAFSNSKIGMLYIPEVTISIETNAFQNASVKFILNNSDMTIKKGYSTYGYIAKSSYSVINDVESIVYENDYLFEDWTSKFHNGMRIRVGGSWENNWYVFNTELIVIENNNTNNNTFTAMKRLVRQLVDFVKRNKKVN